MGRRNCRRAWDCLSSGHFAGSGFVLVAVHPNALEQSRKIKPEIPLIGDDGIPLRDEIELEMML